MRFIVGSLLLFSIFSVDDSTTPRPVATHIESIAYPGLARQAAIQSTVNVAIIVASDGGIFSATAISGHPLFKQAVENNIRMWRFDPSSASSRPLTVTYEFRLEAPKTNCRAESRNAFELPTKVTVISNFPEPQP
jgi:TonB family protein